MVAHIWPGNTARHPAIVGDWRNIPFAPDTFSTAVGDGSLCGLLWPDEHRRVLTGVSGALNGSGRFVCRVYAPAAYESVSAVREAALTGAIGGFHAFKLRLAMALAAQRQDARVGVSELLDAFDTLFS